MKFNFWQWLGLILLAVGLLLVAIKRMNTSDPSKSPDVSPRIAPPATTLPSAP